jgi:hypothetical protein
MPEMTDDDRDRVDSGRLESVVRAHVVQLGEWFDCVAIFASKTDGDLTHCHQQGQGNIYARIGHAREWVIKQDEKARIEARAEAAGDDDP